MLVFLLVCSLAADFGQARDRSLEYDPKFWRDLAQDALKVTLGYKENKNVAKNVILFLGDGMGASTIAAGRIYKGQKQGQSGEEGSLVWDKFQDVALLKTYTVDKQVTDSAGAATSYLCGVKSNIEMVGLNAQAIKSKCSSAKGKELTSIFNWFQDAGKSTGIVTTSRVTHASPAGGFAHCPDREWESDDGIPESEKDCKDIAKQLVEDVPGKNIKVIMGGGRRHFFPKNTVDKVYNKANFREDGQNLVEKWMEDKMARGASFQYVSSTGELNNVDLKNTDYLLGLFGFSHVDYELDRDKSDNGAPSIAHMTEKAIDRLSQDPNGYFLFVEGARIDHAHHDCYGIHALEETVQFEKAVELALKKTNPEETLIVVTADHDHAFKFNGDQQPRGTNITGVADNSMDDGLPYTVMMYTTGPGYVKDSIAERKKYTKDFIFEKDYQYLALVPRNWSAHGGDDVQAFAYGPMAHLFKGVQEQNYVAHALAYASCVGQNKEHCTPSSGNNIFIKPFIIFQLFAFIFIVAL